MPGGSERLKRVRLLTAGAILSLVVTACGSGGSGTASSSAAPPSVSKDAALAALVPADVSADTKLIIGTDASYAPNEFTDTDGKTIIGMDVELGTAIAQKLGMTAEFQNNAFDGIIPAIQAGKYEAAMSSFSVNDERVKIVDMVSYFSSRTRLGTLKGNPEGLSVDNLCGKNVAVQRGTTQVDDLAKRSKACTAGGKPAINVTELQLQTDVNLALVSKRVSAMLADAPVVGYAQKTTNGEVEGAGATYDSAPYGVVLPKSKGGLAKAVQGAIQALITDGTYKRILDKWGVAEGAIPTSEIKG